MSVRHPQVTVFIPVYNRERYVGPAIDSILAQNFSDYELLLIDDGSTDLSLERMRAYTDPRVRIVCNKRNRGIPRTRNTGLQLARGKYIAMLDSDDLAHPKRLEKQVVGACLSPFITSSEWNNLTARWRVHNGSISPLRRRRSRITFDWNGLSSRCHFAGFIVGKGQRKVRAPQDRVVGNAHRPQGQGQCHRK